jgi:hypothetical protein
MKDKIIFGIVGALATSIVGLAVAWGAGVFKAGTNALTEDQIKSVLQETLVTTINGETKTYGEALSLLSTNQTIMKTKLGSMEKALAALSTD